jgi:hypothetical protein
MLTFGLALWFSISMGLRGASLWWSVLAALCIDVVGILTSVIGYTSQGRSLNDILMDGYWGQNLGRLAFIAILLCGAQALTRWIVSRRRRRETSN